MGWLITLIISLWITLIGAIACLAGNKIDENLLPVFIFFILAIVSYFKFKKSKKKIGNGTVKGSTKSCEECIKDYEKGDNDVKKIKCNCEGCLNQEVCKYGYVVYNDITNEKMSLLDKFMMLHTFDNFEPAEIEISDIVTNEELHNKKKLFLLEKDKLKITLTFLQEQKKNILQVGKCGRAYFNFMNMDDEIKLVKETIKEYDSYYERLSRIESIRPFILQTLELNGSVFQKDLFAEYNEVGKGKVSKVIEQLVTEKIIKKEKSGNTYLISKI